MKNAKFQHAKKPTTLLTLIDQGYDADLDALITKEAAIEAANHAAYVASIKPPATPAYTAGKPSGLVCLNCDQPLNEAAGETHEGTLHHPSLTTNTWSCPKNNDDGGWHKSGQVFPIFKDKAAAFAETYGHIFPPVKPASMSLGTLDKMLKDMFKPEMTMLLYGEPGIGKTTASAAFEEAWCLKPAKPETPKDVWLDQFRAVCVARDVPGDWVARVDHSPVSDAYVFVAYDTVTGQEYVRTTVGSHMMLTNPAAQAAFGALSAAFVKKW